MDDGEKSEIRKLLEESNRQHRVEAAALNLKHHEATLRDLFAAQALVGLLPSVCEVGEVAHVAYEIADAMLVERSKSTEAPCEKP